MEIFISGFPGNTGCQAFFGLLTQFSEQNHVETWHAMSLLRLTLKILIYA